MSEELQAAERKLEVHQKVVEKAVDVLDGAITARCPTQIRNAHAKLVEEYDLYIRQYVLTELITPK